MNTKGTIQCCTVEKYCNSGALKHYLNVLKQSHSSGKQSTGTVQHSQQRENKTGLLRPGPLCSAHPALHQPLLLPVRALKARFRDLTSHLSAGTKTRRSGAAARQQLCLLCPRREAARAGSLAGCGQSRPGAWPSGEAALGSRTWPSRAARRLQGPRWF